MAEEVKKYFPDKWNKLESNTACANSNSDKNGFWVEKKKLYLCFTIYSLEVNEVKNKMWVYPTIKQQFNKQNQEKNNLKRNKSKKPKFCHYCKHTIYSQILRWECPIVVIFAISSKL